ncbi:MAG: polysaccharide biosynthesis tyrosine autokinase [Thermodesulfobacteriota bacterium]
MSFSDQEIHLLDYWRVLLKRRKIAVIAFLAIVGAALVYSFLATPVYKGTAQILFDFGNKTMSFSEGESGFVQMKDSKEYYNTQVEIMRSREFGDRIVRKLQLDKNIYFLKKKDDYENGFIKSVLDSVKSWLSMGGEGEDPFPAVSDRQELDPTLTDVVLDGMDIAVNKGSDLLKVSYNSDNPKVSAVMANGIAGAYIEHNLDIRVRPFKDAVEWLSSRLVELRGKVEQSEKELQSYKETKGIVSFEAKENVIMQELNQLVTELVQTEAKKQDADVRHRQIKGVIDQPERLATVPDIMNNPVIQGLRTQELDLRKEVSNLSGKYGAKHPQMVKAKSELEMVQKNLIAEARKMLNAAKTEYEIAKSKEDSIRKRIDEQKQTVLNLSRQAIEFNVVEGESLSNKQFYDILLKKLQEASLSSGVTVSNAQVVDRAVIPESPVSPRKAFNLLVALALGSMLGIGLSFFVEYMDDTLKTPEDVSNVLNVPFLGFVPSTSGDGKQSETRVIHLFDNPKSMISEAYRTIRTGLMLSGVDAPKKVILVTSSIASEGKTTTATNLAVSLAHTGEKVLLVDADLRRQTVHKAFGLERSEGLSDIMLGTADIAKVTKTIPEEPNLHIITGGTHTPNPAELLSSSKLKNFMADARGKYDRVILDSPPLLSVSDPLILSSLVDGVVLVAWGGVTSKEVVLRGLHLLDGVKAKVTGVVLNNMSMKKLDAYHYYSYYYSYAEDEDSKK